MYIFSYSGKKMEQILKINILNMLNIDTLLVHLAAIIDFGNGSESSVINGERSTPTNGMNIRGLYVPN